MIAEAPPTPAQVYSYDSPAVGHMTVRCLDQHNHYRVLFHSPSPAYERKKLPVMTGWMVHIEETNNLKPASS